MAHLSIKGDRCLPLKILVDGREIKGITGLDLRFRYNEITSARIAILVDSIEVDAEALAMLEAFAEKKEADLPQGAEITE